MPLLFVIMLAMTTTNVHCVRRIGYIYFASYISNTSKVIMTYQNTCSECICAGFFSNTALSYQAINCFKNNQTCELLNSSYTPSMMMINLDSTFIFIPQSSAPNNTITFPLSGVTVAGYANGTDAGTLDGLRSPWGLALDKNDVLYVADNANHRVLSFGAGSSTGTIVAGTGTSGSALNQLNSPAEIALDSNSNIYVNDNWDYRVMRWRNNATAGSIVAGNGTSGSGSTTIGNSIGLAIDSQQNIYVSDYTNHRIIKYTSNGTSGTLVAGITGVPGSSNQQLNKPQGLYLDENNSYLYVADLSNHRIQRYRLGNASNGVTVAGGNGVGSRADQLSEPHGVCVSRKTGDVYIADRRNNRIQRWSSGATSGVTVVGTTGIIGTNATLLNSPVNVALSHNETFLFVSDMGNNRVQRYQLI